MNEGEIRELDKEPWRKWVEDAMSKTKRDGKSWNECIQDFTQPSEGNPPPPRVCHTHLWPAPVRSSCVINTLHTLM
jgi:hypothetical protein